MTKKEYLKSISQLDDEIKRNRQRCRTLRDVAMNTSVKYSGDAVQQTRDNNPLEKILAKVIDLERQIENEESRLVDLKAEVAMATIMPHLITLSNLQNILLRNSIFHLSAWFATMTQAAKTVRQV